MKLNWLRCLFCLAVFLSFTASASAEPIVWLDVGAKGAIGGQYYTVPDDNVAGRVAPFYDGAGGIGGGGGMFFEVRALGQHLGLEFDLLFENSKTWCNVNDTDYIMRYTTMRIPILLKGNIVQKTTRVGIGLGPEFIPGLSAKAELVDVAKRNDVALAWEFASAFMVKKVAITFDVRFAYHFTFPKSWDERVSNGTYEAGHTIDMHFLLGAAYVFDFGETKGSKEKKKSSDDDEEDQEEASDDEGEGADESGDEDAEDESDSDDASDIDDLL